VSRAARLVLVIASIAAAACAPAGPTAPAGGGKAPGKPVVVRVMEAQAERVERIVEITGTLAGAEEVVVSAEVEGRVERVAADLGDVVRAGGTLAQLAREVPRLQAAQADAEYAAALARVGVEDAALDAATTTSSSTVRRATAEDDEARRSLVRVVELATKGVAAPADVDAARARAEIAAAQLAAARDDAVAALATAKARRAALGLAKKRLADTTIASPVDGVVAARLVGLGELVKPGQPVARVVIAETLKLRGDVPERYADVLKKGLPLTIEAADVGGRGTGVVGRIGPLVDAATRTFPIEAMLDNKDGRLKPGTFARARVVTGADEDAIALPETAISNLAGVTKVYVVDDENKAVERRVQILRKRGSDALVAGELRPGERVVVTAVARVFPGATVEIDTGPPPTPSGRADRPPGEQPSLPIRAPSSSPSPPAGAAHSPSASPSAARGAPGPSGSAPGAGAR
jgi:RND family efflux transporter MFP subunit